MFRHCEHIPLEEHIFSKGAIRTIVEASKPTSGTKEKSQYVYHMHNVTYITSNEFMCEFTYYFDI